MSFTEFLTNSSFLSIWQVLALKQNSSNWLHMKTISLVTQTWITIKLHLTEEWPPTIYFLVIIVSNTEKYVGFGGLCIICCCFSMCFSTRNTPQESLTTSTSRGLLSILIVLRTRQAFNTEYCCLLTTVSIKTYFQGCDQRKHSN